MRSASSKANHKWRATEDKRDLLGWPISTQHTKNEVIDNSGEQNKEINVKAICL